jgi:hypothetical protein
MNAKVQGGGSSGGKGTYANKGSCRAVTEYLEHEDMKRMQEGHRIEPFFDHERDVSAKEAAYKIDHNHAKLSKDDAKFYVLTISPSAKEIEAMGKTSEERAQAMKSYIRNDVMQAYAEGFNKGLKKYDIMYYAKIHYERKGQNKYDMHCHIIVSRKDKSNTKKLSPQTNHMKAGKGAVKSGFNRSEFYTRCEQSFDKSLGFHRNFKETFEYLNTMKNGTPKEMQAMAAKAAIIEKSAAMELAKANVLNKTVEVAKTLSKDRGMRMSL